jgi:hypothetical protein
MISELTTVSLLQASIAKKLGPGYLVNMNALTSSFSEGAAGAGGNYGRSEMDLVIWGPNPKEPFIVEFKSLRKGVDVPLSTVPLLVELVDKNPGVQPHLIFATGGRVGPLVRAELLRRNIDIVESDDLTDMSAQIASIVQRKSQPAG